MESKKYLKVKVALDRITYGDVNDRNGRLLEHRMFYVADELSKELKTTWTINDTSSYEREMLYKGIIKGLIYKITEITTGMNFQFWLILRQAEMYDCVYTDQFLKINATYYILGDQNRITGPLHIHESDDPIHIKHLINQGQLYVPAAKQLFEDCKAQKSA